MDTDNDAARSGLDEVSGHIQVLNARLAQLRKNGSVSTALESSLEDLQDYYERAVQLRTMRITTLEEEKSELTGKVQQASDRARRIQTMFVISAISFVGCMAEHASPGTIYAFLFEYWSHALLAVVVAMVVKRIN